jgi:hypothetical protein
MATLSLGFIITFANSSMRFPLGAHHSSTSRYFPPRSAPILEPVRLLSHAPYTPLRYSIVRPSVRLLLPSVRILLFARFLFLVVATQKEAFAFFLRAHSASLSPPVCTLFVSRLCVHPVRPRYHLPALPSVVPLSDETYRVLISLCSPEFRSGLFAYRNAKHKRTFCFVQGLHICGRDFCIESPLQLQQFSAEPESVGPRESDRGNALICTGVSGGRATHGSTDLNAVYSALCASLDIRPRPWFAPWTPR